MTASAKIILFLLAVLVSADAVSLSKTVDKVSSVIMYSSSMSEVVRKVVIQEPLPAGVHQLLINGLSSQIDDSSIELWMQPSAADKNTFEVEILDIKLSQSQIQKDQDPTYVKTVKALRSSLDELNQLISANDRTGALLEQKSRTMHRFLEQATLTLNATSIKAALNLLEFQEEQFRALNVKIDENSRRKKALLDEVKELNDQIRKLNDQGIAPLPADSPSSALPVVFYTKTEKALSFQFNLKRATTAACEVFVSYMISPTRWQAEYDIRVGEHAKAEASQLPGQYNIELDYFAVVEQNTGEDWADVQLALSTSRPGHAGTLPKPESRGVYFDNQMFKSKRHSGGEIHLEGGPAMFNRESMNMMDSSFSSMPAGGVFNMAAETVAVGDLSAVYLFSINYNVSITSTSSVSQTVRPFRVIRHRLLIDKIRFPSSVYAFAVPSSGSGAFLRLWTTLPKNISTSMLESDSARVFLENSYSGITRFDAVKQGGEVNVNLGQSHNIQVTSTQVLPQNHKMVEDKSTWFVTDKERFRVKTEERMFTVKSNYPTGSQDMLVVLTENLPRSSDSEITVQLQSPSEADVTDSLSSAQKVLAATPALAHYYDALVSPTTEEEEFSSAVIMAAHQLKASDGAGNGKASKKFHVFKCAVTGTVYWVKWMAPGETVSGAYKYRVLWPEKKPDVLIQ